MEQFNTLKVKFIARVFEKIYQSFDVPTQL